jgi:hypothetical protein
MRSLALPPAQKNFAPLRLYWLRSPFTYVSYFTTTVRTHRLLLAVGAAVIN